MKTRYWPAFVEIVNGYSYIFLFFEVLDTKASAFIADLTDKCTILFVERFGDDFEKCLHAGCKISDISYCHKTSKATARRFFQKCSLFTAAENDTSKMAPWRICQKTGSLQNPSPVSVSDDPVATAKYGATRFFKNKIHCFAVDRSKVWQWRPDVQKTGQFR